MKRTLKNIDFNLISEFILSILVLLMGVIVMIFKTFGLIEIVLYGSILFYIFAVFSTVLYFVGRKEGDYELLLLAFINIIAATFMFIFKSDNPPMILGAGMTIYTILLVANRGIKILTLKREENFIWIVKFIVTFLIGFLGMLTTFNLFNEVTVQTMMFGFYFISLGFMLSIESIIEIFITDDTFKKILSKVIEDETTKNLEEIEDVMIVKKEDLQTGSEVEHKEKTKTAEKKKKDISDKTKKVDSPKETKTNKQKKEIKSEIKNEDKKVAKKIKEDNGSKIKTTTAKKEIATKDDVNKTTKKRGRPKKSETK